MASTPKAAVAAAKAPKKAATGSRLTTAATATAASTKHEDFVLKFEVAIIEHLGLNLYSEVHSAISELIANAFDADASQVSVQLPVGVQLGQHSQKIVITDNGHGMTYEEARDRYLRIGLNRRKTGNALSRVGKRKALGRKGIGKLAGFGIADEITVRTVAPVSWKGDKPNAARVLTEFTLDLDDILEAPAVMKDEAVKDPDAPDLTRKYQPNVKHKNVPTEEPLGTVITLRKLRTLDAIELDDFITLMTRKFAVFDSKFEVTIEPKGGTPQKLSRFDLACSIRFPERDGGPHGDGWLKDFVEVPGGVKQEVRYWIGFTERPIRRASERGISVLAGKQVQEPFEFKLAGGTTGQFGLQYLTGQVEANWLDDETSSTDIIASDRSSVRWSDPRAAALLTWGQAKLKALLSEWISRRAKKTVQDIIDDAPELEEEIASYSGAALDELRKVIARISTELADVEKERRIEVVRSVVDAYQHKHIQTVLNAIVDLPGNTSLQGFAEALKAWNLMDAVVTFQELISKADVLLAFTALVQGGATEVKSKKGDLSLHELLSENPWLIDPSYGEMYSELNVDKFLFEKFDYTPPKTTRMADDLRADFIAVYRDGDIRLIEIKSAKGPIDERGLTNLEIYHERAKAAVSKSKSADGLPWRVRSMLIHNGEEPATEGGRARLRAIERDVEQYQTYVWMDLLRRNGLIYKETLERVRARNPTDPRIVALYNTYASRLGAAISSKDRAKARKLSRPVATAVTGLSASASTGPKRPVSAAASTPQRASPKTKASAVAAVAPARKKPGPKPKSK